MSFTTRWAELSPHPSTSTDIPLVHTPPVEQVSAPALCLSPCLFLHPWAHALVTEAPWGPRALVRWLICQPHLPLYLLPISHSQYKFSSLFYSSLQADCSCVKNLFVLCLLLFNFTDDSFQHNWMDLLLSLSIPCLELPVLYKLL